MVRAPQPSANPDQRAGNADPGLPALLEQHRWLVYVLPLAVYMLVGSLEPTSPDEATWLGIRYEHYPLVYTLKIAAALAAMALVLPGYRAWPLKLSPLSVLVGVVGVGLWVGLEHLGLEEALLPEFVQKALGGLGQRTAYNPLSANTLGDTPLFAYAFLAVRFLGLAAIVPVIEEFFLRGFVIRYVADEKWWQVPFGTWHLGGIAAATALAVLMHPGELVAELVWFSLVTWLMLKTRSLWDCVAAHAVTNLLLGLWVLATGEWHFM